ncbi:Crossover junction endonuclease eme1 [Tolypocladium ophioglossoides CBS 100239]|uniref:Crossover junction endonuclease eme1 n=1 Tax=Tolypocladium ophioglossoides (strain CBS 100239) TaxID=1163406 RepID=A0A0L0N0Y2_TOLOC|nr:Crossover junction endonuclease eme1 [Tolypocladium ophioglossoides CBS 100239]
MAPHVIDLVSSSPSPWASPPPLLATSNHNNSNGTLKRPATAAAAAAAGRGNVTAKASLTDLVSLSDGLDFSDDEFNPFAAPDSGRKRRRTVSPARQSITVPGASRPPLLDRRRVPLSRKGLEPIEVSSSMEQAPPKNRPPPGDPCDAPWDISSPIIRLASPKAPARPVDSDPFASSPEPLRRHAKSPGRPISRAVSLDPFESSPMPVAGSPSKQSTARRSPFPGAGARAYDSGSFRHGAHSNHLLAQPLQSERVTEFSDTQVINIDDSDSSTGSDDSEFPDVADIDVSRRSYKPRSPLRRSRSENITRSDTGAGRCNRRQPIDKDARAVVKAAEKEQKRREREQAKAAKAQEKERAAALAEVNKLRTDKKVSTPEMIVDLPSSLASEHRVQLEVLLEGLGVEYTTWQSPDQSIVKWRRKVTSRFDEDLGHWEPIPPRIHEEKHVLTILTADEFVGLVTRDELQAHVSKTKGKFSRHHTIYLLQGMTPWLRKNRNLRNRQFASGVRAHQELVNPSRDQRRNESSKGGYISEDLIEDAMLRLQVKHDIFIHHTMIAAETAKWVATFTQHISTIPYRKQKDNATSTAGFCMESGQVRTGEGPQDTYVRMLQEIVRITAPIAYGIAVEFDSVTKLVKGLETGGPERLDGVRKSANKDGQLSDRTVGQAVSRRVYKVFTGRDEGSTDV